MYDPFNTKPAVNTKEALTGALLLLGFIGTILCIALVWFVWYFYLSPKPEPVVATSTALPAPPTWTPQPTLAPVYGELDFGGFGISVAPNCMFTTSFDLNKAGQRIPNQTPATSDVTINGNDVATTASANGDQRQLMFNGSSLCTSRGTIRIRARIQQYVAVRTLYFSGLPAPKPKSKIGNVQVDADRYPDLTTYFGVVDENGSAEQLGGLTTTQISQDGTNVPNFTMSAVDPTANPVTVALLIDTSGSMQGDPLKNARQAAAGFIGNLSPNDSACVYSFSTAVTQGAKCTTDHPAAANALNSLNAVGNTAFYDVLVAVAADHAKLTGRQAIIVLTDGADTASKAKLPDALARIKQANVPLYTIGLINKDLNSATLRQFATETGGMYLEAPSSTDLQKLYAQIQGQLQNQYRVGFQSLYPERKSGTIALRLTTADQVIETSRPFFVK